MAKAIEGAAEIIGGVALALTGVGLPAALALGLEAAGTVLGSVGIATEAGAIAQALGSNQGMGVTTRQSAANRQIIRGEQRIGGTIVFSSTTGSTKRQYNLVIVLATHPCEAIENLYLDGRQVYWNTSSSYNQTINGVNFGGNADGNNHEGPNGVQYNFGGEVFCAAFCGKQDSNPTVVGGTWVGPSTWNNGDAAYPGYCSALNANDGTWAPNGSGTPYLAGCTYVYLKLEADSSNFPQFPEIRFTVRGKNDIWDPRTSTRGYTKNWALHIADAITDPTWGLGDPTVNQDQLIAAANVCDELVETASDVATWEPDTNYYVGQIFTESGSAYLVTSNYVSGATFGSTDTSNTTSTTAAIFEARYCLHWHYDTSTSPGDAIQQMMSAAMGRLSRVGGEWYIWPRYWQGPSFSFDESALLAGIQWNPKRTISDLFNRVTGTYIAPNFPYNVAGDLYDTNGFYNGNTQNNFPYAFQPTNYPEYACDALHGYGEDVYLIADTPNSGAYNSGTAYPAGAVVTYSGGLWQALQSTTGNTPASGSAYWAPTGNYLPREIPQPCVLSLGQAQRLAKLNLLANRQQGSGQLTMSLAAFQMCPLDVMQFSSATLGWTDKYLEISMEGADWCVRLTRGQPGGAGDGSEGDAAVPGYFVQVRVQETDPSAFADLAPGEELTAYDVPVFSGGTNTYIVAPPTGASAISDLATALVQPDGTVIPRIELTWTEPTDTYVTNGGQIEIQMCAHSSAAWQDVLVLGGQATLAFLGNVVAGAAYDVRLRAVRSNGAQSAWVEIDNVVVGYALSVTPSLGAPLAPGALIGIALSGGGANILVEPFTAVVGTASVSVLPAGEYTITGESQDQLYYVYYYDPTFAGGAITPIATQNIADFVGKPGYYYIGSVITPVYTGGGGGGGVTVYRPTSWTDQGTQSTQSPSAVFSPGGTTTVGARNVAGGGGGPVYADIVYGGFGSGLTSGSKTLTVTAALLVSGGGSLGASTITSSLGALFSASTATASASYTVTVPSGTDLSTITVECTAGPPTSGGSTIVRLNISDIDIQ